MPGYGDGTGWCPPPRHHSSLSLSPSSPRSWPSTRGSWRACRTSTSSRWCPPMPTWTTTTAWSCPPSCRWELWGHPHSSWLLGGHSLWAGHGGGLTRLGQVPVLSAWSPALSPRGHGGRVGVCHWLSAGSGRRPLRAAAGPLEHGGPGGGGDLQGHAGVVPERFGGGHAGNATRPLVPYGWQVGTGEHPSPSPLLLPAAGVPGAGPAPLPAGPRRLHAGTRAAFPAHRHP